MANIIEWFAGGSLRADEQVPTVLFYESPRCHVCPCSVSVVYICLFLARYLEHWNAVFALGALFHFHRQLSIPSSEATTHQTRLSRS